MKTPHLFFEETNGKIIDIDGSYGGQCWDLWALFCQEYCNKIYGCRWSGGVKDMWYHFDELGLGEFFEKIPPEKYHELQDGDWLVWDQDTNPLCWISTARNEKGETYGHIAMFRQYNPSNSEQNVILTQNPGGNPNYTHQMVCDFLGFIGALRPKCYIIQDKNLPNPVEENKQVDQLKVNCDDTMRVRLGHNLDAEIIGFAKSGFYNILQKCDDVDYTWCEVEENKWIAICPPSCEYVTKMQETPQNQEEGQDSPIIQEQPKTLENEPNNEEIELINRDKHNPLVEFIVWIIKLIQKWKGNNKDGKR